MNVDEKIILNGGYVDGTIGPLANVTDLKKSGGLVSNRFKGLTVTVLAPVQMDCWLVNGVADMHWRIKSLAPLATYAALTTATETIMANIPKMLAIGTEATVTADETNDNKPTKYWVTAVSGTEVTWEKMNNGGGDLSKYLEKDIIDGEDME